MSGRSPNGDMPANPVDCIWTDDGRPSHGNQTGNTTGWATGLTKRELFAAMAMQGIQSMLSDPSVIEAVAANAKAAGIETDQYVAENAVSLADALLAELAKDGAA